MRSSPTNEIKMFSKSVDHSTLKISSAPVLSHPDPLVLPHPDPPVLPHPDPPVLPHPDPPVLPHPDPPVLPHPDPPVLHQPFGYSNAVKLEHQRGDRKLLPLPPPLIKMFPSPENGSTQRSPLISCVPFEKSKLGAVAMATIEQPSNTPPKGSSAHPTTSENRRTCSDGVSFQIPHLLLLRYSKPRWVSPAVKYSSVHNRAAQAYRDCRPLSEVDILQRIYYKTASSVPFVRNNDNPVVGRVDSISTPTLTTTCGNGNCNLVLMKGLQSRQTRGQKRRHTTVLKPKRRARKKAAPVIQDRYDQLPNMVDRCMMQHSPRNPTVPILRPECIVQYRKSFVHQAQPPVLSAMRPAAGNSYITTSSGYTTGSAATPYQTSHMASSEAFIATPYLQAFANSRIRPSSSTGIHPSSSTGIHPSSSTGIHPSSSTGIHPSSSPGIHPSSSTGIHPSSSTGIHPSSSTGIHPSSSTGIHPFSSTGIHPFSSTGIHPSSNTGIYSSSSTGTRPSSNTGIYPSSSTGFYTSNTGIYSSSSTGIHPSSSTGIHPSSSTGIHPSSSTGIHPSSSTGIHPSSSTGIHPSSSTGIHPSSSTVIHPSSSTGIYSSSNTGIHPSSSTGIHPSSSTGIHPSSSLTTLTSTTFKSPVSHSIPCKAATSSKLGTFSHIKNYWSKMSALFPTRTHDCKRLVGQTSENSSDVMFLIIGLMDLKPSLDVPAHNGCSMDQLVKPLEAEKCLKKLFGGESYTCDNIAENSNSKINCQLWRKKLPEKQPAPADGLCEASLPIEKDRGANRWLTTLPKKRKAKVIIEKGESIPIEKDGGADRRLTILPKKRKAKVIIEKGESIPIEKLIYFFRKETLDPMVVKLPRQLSCLQKTPSFNSVQSRDSLPQFVVSVERMLLPSNTTYSISPQLPRVSAEEFEETCLQSLQSLAKHYNSHFTLPNDTQSICHAMSGALHNVCALIEKQFKVSIGQKCDCLESVLTILFKLARWCMKLNMVGLYIILLWTLLSSLTSNYRNIPSPSMEVCSQLASFILEHAAVSSS